MYILYTFMNNITGKKNRKKSIMSVCVCECVCTQRETGGGAGGTFLYQILMSSTIMCSTVLCNFHQCKGKKIHRNADSYDVEGTTPNLSSSKHHRICCVRSKRWRNNTTRHVHNNTDKTTSKKELFIIESSLSLCPYISQMYLKVIPSKVSSIAVQHHLFGLSKIQ
jgi:hypothetical protein